MRAKFLLSALSTLAILACQDGSRGTPAASSRPKRPEVAQWDTFHALKADLKAPRHPADGGGRAWIEEPQPATVSTPGRWSVVYEAGPLGVAEGGMIFLQVSPFWGWSTPQVTHPGAPGFTEVESLAEGLELLPETLDSQLMVIHISGRRLERGERVRIVYGAGEVGAVADRYAERQSRIWIAVDGDGDGVRGLIADSPSLVVRPGDPARLLLTLPSTARPGEPVRLALAVVDQVGNAGLEVEGEVRLSSTAAGPGLVDLPSTVRLTAADGGHKVIELTAAAEGIVRLRGEGPRALVGESNPLLVSASTRRVLWGDLHGHSNFSDGTGVPEDYFLYARDIAALDVVALTDHDHWGMRFLDQSPDLWNEILEQTRRFHNPGRFVTIPGYEWTSWVYGHRHVLDLSDSSLGSESFKILSSMNPDFESPEQLWETLRGGDVLTVAHHSAGGPIGTDWTTPPDPELEPVTEIVSVHGSSEAEDSPARIYSPIPGNFVRDVLDRGLRLGFIGSGDGHDGHPGLSHLVSPVGGLAAILSEDLSRSGVLEALRARRVYATSGPRILLDATFAGWPMGAEIPLTELAGLPESGSSAAASGPEPNLRVRIVAPEPVEQVDIIRSGEVDASLAGNGRRELSFQRQLTDLEVGEYLYLRVVQQDGGLAFSSPFFFVQ